MHGFQRNLILKLTLLLVLSQWLSLAHTTEHLIKADDTYCQVCTLQHHFQSTTINTNSIVFSPDINDEIQEYIYLLSISGPKNTQVIRAPPQ